MGLKTTTIGSFPKPLELRRARWRFAEGAMAEEDLRRIEQQALADLLKLQTRLGLDVWVDGQLDREDMLGHFAGPIEGLAPGGWVRAYANRYYRRPVVVGPLRRARALIVDAWARAQAQAERPIKAVLTGPYTLMHWSFDEHYATREECCAAFAELLREEVQALIDAGAEEIQLDEPAISARAEEMELVARCLARVTAGHRGTARFWAHLCYGDYGPVMPQILSLPVDGLLLELANRGHGALDELRSWPEDKLLGAGVIDVISPEIESRSDLRVRIERLLQVVPAPRLWIAPDAGLRTLPADVARGKLEAMVRAAAD